MNERMPQKPERISKEEFAALAQELSAFPEGFQFRGIARKEYESLLALETEFPELYPEKVLKIDELIRQFEEKGMQVMLTGKQQDDAVIVPFGSKDIEAGSIFPRDLMVHPDMHPGLKKLILAKKK